MIILILQIVIAYIGIALLFAWITKLLS